MLKNPSKKKKKLIRGNPKFYNSPKRLRISKSVIIHHSEIIFTLNANLIKYMDIPNQHISVSLLKVSLNLAKPIPR